MRSIIVAFSVIALLLTTLLQEALSQESTPDSIRTTYHKSGAKRSETPWKDGVKHGVEVWWDENGKKRYETPYKDGEKHGVRVMYYESGAKLYETPYKDGEKHGVEVWWDENGKKRYEIPYKAGEKHGVVKKWDQQGNMMKTDRGKYDTEVLALIPAGTFRMGDITGTGYGDEKPVHEVTITRPFLMGLTEVTQVQYEAVMGSNPSAFEGPDLPVETVNWYEAVEFCNELSRQEGLDPCYSGSDTNIVCDFTANGYRLPTEAEWEYACRAGMEMDFYTGNMTSPDGFDPALDRAGWFYENSGSTTHPVGEKEANASGLYDMHGNVMEWCWDWFGSDYYATSPAEDPRGPASGSYRVLRGGSWSGLARGCRSACRISRYPVNRDYSVGFRVVRTY